MKREKQSVRMLHGNNEYSEVWNTPDSFFNELDSEFHFDLDPCCTHESAKCEKHFTPEDDGLVQDWGGYTVFMNPPYGRAITDWVRKASEESQKPNTVIVALLPARTDTRWFWDYVLPYAQIRFIKGRLHFNNSKDSAPFASILAIYGVKHD